VEVVEKRDRVNDENGNHYGCSDAALSPEQHSLGFSVSMFAVLIRRRCLSQSMIKVKPVDVAQQGYNKGVLKAYLEGEKNMNWVVGCLRGISMQEFDSIVLELSGYRNFPRYADNSEIRRRLLVLQ
jgi:hypothetical protein